jgi:acetyl-CoA carboxylase carboxyltransferase component
MVSAHAVAVGDEVEPGDPLVMVETMKCESPVGADHGGRVGWLAPLGTVVARGDDLARIDAQAPARPPSPSQVVDLLVGRAPEPRLARFVEGASFVELDLDRDPVRPDRLVEVEHPQPSRAAGVVVGRLSHRLAPHVEPVERIWLCGDATRSLGAVAEPECRRIVAAIDLAEREGLALEWVAVSAGARISMSSGTENMDWCAVVVRRLVEFTQAGGQVVVVVAGINVGAQSYWNAEATMLMHCAGLLVMVEGTAMVLTGHRALARAGGESERSDHDLGGTPVMGANGQAHHCVRDLVEALALVLEHHGLCASGPRHPAVQAPTEDTPERDVCEDPLHPDALSDTREDTLASVLHGLANPRRSRPFAIESVMGALVDRDAPVLRRWQEAAGAGGVHVWDTRVDGWAVSLIGVESRPHRGAAGWEAAGTLYPMGAHKLARALNHASGRRPAVVLANLAGFDGSRSSLLDRQLEQGAELARAVVNFRGPLVVVVIGRFHGGAYVVLSQRLNPWVRIVALEGTRVSVIGGSAAAEVVLHREVDAHLDADPGTSRDAAVANVADRFDRVHDVHRAVRTGAVEAVITPEQLRPSVARLVAAVPQPVDLSSTRCPAPRPAGRSAAPV